MLSVGRFIVNICFWVMQRQWGRLMSPYFDCRMHYSKTDVLGLECERLRVVTSSPARASAPRPTSCHYSGTLAYACIIECLEVWVESLGHVYLLDILDSTLGWC